MALTPELRKGIDQIRNYLFGGGYPDPMANAEQLSFFFFFYLIEGLDYDNLLRAKATSQEYQSIFFGEWNLVNPLNSPEKNQSKIPAEHLRWSIWAKGRTGEDLVRWVRDEVFAFYAELAEKSAMNFMDGARLGIDEPTVLTQVVSLIDSLRLDQADADTKGDLFEYVLKQIKQAGELGQFRTPRHIIRAIVEIVDPQLGETVYDPAAGTAGFLVAAYNHIRLANSSPSAIEEVEMDGKQIIRGWGDKLSITQSSMLANKTFFGNDVDPKMVRLATMNLTLRGLPNVQILKRNALTTTMDTTDKSEKGLPLHGYDVVLANPPFSGSVDKDRIVDDVKVGSTTATELLFLKYMLNSIKEGGRCGVIVPEGVLERPSSAHIELRRQLIENNCLEAIISLPSGVFQPYSGVKTSVIIFKKGGRTENVMFLSVINDGYKLDANHDISIDDDDLPQSINDFKNRDDNLLLWSQKQDLSDWDKRWWFADVSAIKNNEFNLSASSYKPKKTSTLVHAEISGSLSELNKLQEINSQKVGILCEKIPSFLASFDKLKTNEGCWRNVALKEVALVGSGSGFPLKYQGNKDAQYPFYKVSDMNVKGNETLMGRANNYISENDRKTLNAKVFEENTIIFPKIGAAIATNKKRILSKPSCFDNNVMGITVRNEIRPLFLYALLLNKNISEFASDSNPPSIRKSKVEDWIISLPPIEFQCEFEEFFLKISQIKKDLSVINGLTDSVFNSFLNKLAD